MLWLVNVAAVAALLVALGAQWWGPAASLAALLGPYDSVARRYRRRRLRLTLVLVTLIVLNALVVLAHVL